MTKALPHHLPKLNRDTWANEAVAQTIRTNFIFWQVGVWLPLICIYIYYWSLIIHFPPNISVFTLVFFFSFSNGCIVLVSKHILVSIICPFQIMFILYLPYDYFRCIMMRARGRRFARTTTWLLFLRFLSLIPSLDKKCVPGVAWYNLSVCWRY